jgi:hypothetical protein
MIVLPFVAAVIAGSLASSLGGCATEESSVQVQRYADEKSEFTLDIENAGKRFSPQSRDCGTYSRNDYQGVRGDAHAIATCARSRAQAGRPFRMHVCTSGIDFGYCRTTVIPGDGRMIVFYVEWATDSTDFDAVECADYVLHPKTKDMRTGTLKELEFLESETCQHSEELYELMLNRTPANAAT